MLATVNAYTILKTIHVLAAVIWVGGAVTVNIIGTRAVRSQGPHAVAVARDTEWIGTHVYFPSSLTVLLTGILAAINAHYSLASAWLVVGMAGVVLTPLTGSLFLGPD